MLDFYSLNPNHHANAASSLSPVTLTLNESLDNKEFDALFETYSLNPNEELQDKLGAHLNNMHYLVGLFTDENDKLSPSGGELTLEKGDELKLLICSNDEREVFLPVFTNVTEVATWTNEPISTLTVPAVWLWKFILKSNNYTGLVINPGSISWCINLEHIQSLLDDLA